MKQRLYSYLLLSSLPFLVNTGLLSCNGKCKDLPFTPDVREYFLDFKEGSYWIYRNVANGDIDSVYFVSQNIYPSAGAKGGPICSQEYSTVKFTGFAEKQFGYVVKSWNNEMEISSSSEIGFAGDYNFQKVEDRLFSGQKYNEVIILINCCFNGCNNACDKNYFRFLKLYYARQIGIVRWEAENHPQYGNAIYELIRYKVNR